MADIAGGLLDVHPGGQRQRRRLRQLHLPGAGQRRHRQRRRRPRPDAQHDDGQRHRGQRRAGRHRQHRHHARGHRLLVHRGRLRLQRSERRAGQQPRGGQDHHPAAGRHADRQRRARCAPASSIALADIAGGLLKFTPAANANGAGYASFTFQVQDNGGTANGGVDLDPTPNTITVNVTSVNDAPTAAAPAAYGATEQTLLNLAGTGLVVGDVDALGGNVTVTLSVASGVVNATAGATGVVVSNSGTATVRLDGTLAQVNALLSGAGGATLSYLNGSDIPPASDTLTLAISDNGNTGSGGPLSANVNATINITAVDDAPMNTVAGAQTTAEDTPLVFSAVNGTQVSVGDADAGAALIEVTLTVANGSVTLASVGGLAFQAGANGTATMIVRGTIASINAALDGMIYLPGANYSGSDVLTITTNDLGNTGIGGPLSDTDMVAITITR